MNAIVKNDQSAAIMEAVLSSGDLERLTPQQRVEYYVSVCDSIGVNWRTRPFRFLKFQGQTTMYATRDLGDQLRSLRRVSISIVDKQFDGGLFMVTARALTPDGRKDEDMGVVTLGNLQGEARANAIMKAITKAKRRVTLSICGLGYLDENEVETLAGSQTFDVEDITDQKAIEPPPKPRTVSQWLDEMALRLATCPDEHDLEAVLEEVGPKVGKLTGAALAEWERLLAETQERLVGVGEEEPA